MTCMSCWVLDGRARLREGRVAKHGRRSGKQHASVTSTQRACGVAKKKEMRNPPGHWSRSCSAVKNAYPYVLRFYALVGQPCRPRPTRGPAVRAAFVHGRKAWLPRPQSVCGPIKAPPLYRTRAGWLCAGHPAHFIREFRHGEKTPRAAARRAVRCALEGGQRPRVTLVPARGSGGRSPGSPVSVCARENGATTQCCACLPVMPNEIGRFG